MKVIKDSIHGDIYLSYSDCRLIDTPEIQRLRGVSQLGTVKWVYPGANHTRFEHSLGTLYLALKIARNVLFERNELKELKAIRNELSASAIFHDCGHLPFSHCLEEAGLVSDKKEKGKLIGHKQRSAEIAERVIDSLKDINISGREVYRTVLGTKQDYLSDIISGTLDADRIDYLLRDQLHTGVTYGGIDLRVLSLLKRRLNRLVIDERGIVPAETVLHSRYVLRSIMYDHKITRCVQSMIARAFEYATGRDDINKGKELSITQDELEKWTDEQLLLKLEKFDYSKELITRIHNRTLLKLAGIALKKFLQKPGGSIRIVEEMTTEKRCNVENSIAEKLGVKPYEVIIDKGNIDRYAIQEAKIPIFREEENLGTLGHVSGIANDINAQHEMLWGIRLYTPEKIMGAARETFTKLTGVELQKTAKLRISYSHFR